MHVQFQREARSDYEYGCDLRRLYPWPGVADPLWGGAIASVRPGESTSPHAHDEEETFLFLSGRGEMTINDEVEEVTAGDIVFIPRNSHHTVRNLSDEARLDFLSIFWGSPEANKRTLAMADELRAETATAS